MAELIPESVAQQQIEQDSKTERVDISITTQLGFVLFVTTPGKTIAWPPQVALEIGSAIVKAALQLGARGTPEP